MEITREAANRCDKPAARFLSEIVDSHDVLLRHGLGIFMRDFAKVFDGEAVQGRNRSRKFALATRHAMGYRRQQFDAQVQCFLDRCTPALPRFAELKQECARVVDALAAQEAVFFRDFLLFQVRLHDSGCRGLTLLCRSIQAQRAGQHPQAFVLASQSLWAFQESLDAMHDAEHGKWQHFFRGDWLTNVKSTLYSLDALRKYIRMFGDNPDYFLWHKAYLMPESEKKIYLENTHRNPPSDDDLAERLRIRFGL